MSPYQGLACVPVPHEPHWDEYGDCPGFVGPEEYRWSDEQDEISADLQAHGNAGACCDSLCWCHDATGV
jgi:hypothetical protein